MGKIVFFCIPDSLVNPRPAEETNEAAAAGLDARAFHREDFDLAIRLRFGTTELDKHFRRGHSSGDRPELISLNPELEHPALLAALGQTLPDSTTIDEGTRQMLQPRLERLVRKPDYAVAIVGTEGWLNPILAYLCQRCTGGTALPWIAPWQLIGVNFSAGQVTMTLINREPRPQPVRAV